MDKIHFKSFMDSCFLTTCHDRTESLINNIKGKIVLQIMMDKSELVFKQNINFTDNKEIFPFYDNEFSFKNHKYEFRMHIIFQK